MATEDSNAKIYANDSTNSNIFHRRTNHDPRYSNCLTNQSSPFIQQPSLLPSSVGCLEEGKENEQGKLKTSGRKKWFSWFSNNTKTAEKSETRESRNGLGNSIRGSAKQEQASVQESSSFKILQLTASPGGARKRYAAFPPRSFQTADKNSSRVQEESCPGFEDMSVEDVDNVASRGSLRERSLTVSDFSSYQ
jgi:hypothetical protein